MSSGSGRRKEEHLLISLEEDVEAQGITNGLERYHFVHNALPELDLAQVDLSTTFLGKKLKAPLFISPMTGGFPAAGLINRHLAEAAQALGVPMAVGSQRRALEDPGVADTYRVRQVAPDILLFASLGAVQLNNGYGLSECRRSVEMLEANGLILHLNPLQEALQEEGNTNFAGLLSKIEAICRGLPFPVIIKEVGWGISEDVASRLAEVGVAAVDVAGAGGTSWSEVEKRRSRSPQRREVAQAFASWGIPTAEAVIRARREAPHLPLIASGGIHNGVEAAKALALGADLVGVARPLLKRAIISPQEVIDYFNILTSQLRIAMFSIGASSLRELARTPYLQGPGES